MAEKPKIGWALIGYGGMGSWHVDNVRKQIPDIEFLGVYDIKEERQQRAREKGIHAYESREALLSDPRVQLVTIATTNEVHEEIAIDAMRHGKNVISEKPVTLSPESLERMIAVAEETGMLFTVHQNRRWDWDYLCAKKIIDDNTMGHVFQIESRVHGSRGIPGDWRGIKKYGGGMVYDWGVHLFDQMLTLMGDRKLLSVYAQLTHVTVGEVDDGFRAIFKFEDDYSWLVEVLTNNFYSLPRWYLCGMNGSAVIKDWDCRGSITMVEDWENKDALPIQAGAGLTKTMAPRGTDSIKEFPLPSDTKAWNDVVKSWSRFYENVVATIRGEETQIVTWDQQRRLVKLIKAVLDSGESGEVIRFE
ncbi:MAG: Gfo/Idh/MocA family oxidoreductase [Oscillospiraceae bacterium]|jgi:predicted dehydrogenase|nr:Gfo/Idh/MocA family oxidoreductase [Oscillospiraceae bacterium]